MNFFKADHSLARISITGIIFFAAIIILYAVVNEIGNSATSEKAEEALRAANKQKNAQIISHKLDEVLANQESIRKRQTQDSIETMKERMEHRREIQSLKNTVIAYQKAEALRLMDTFNRVYYFPNEPKK